MSLQRSKIAWTDYSGGCANFIIGRTPVSEACQNCYARTIIEDRGGRDFSTISFYPEKLRQLRNAKFSTDTATFRRGVGSKSLVFVVDLGDLFHPLVPQEFIYNFLVLCHDRRDVDWQVLTKRPERMCKVILNFYEQSSYPLLQNLWLGTTVENQHRADERIPILLRTPAAVRFVSCEPLLESISLEPFLQYPPMHDNYKLTFGANEWCGLDWVIVGAESGAKRRSFDVAWAKDLYQQCQQAGVKFFAKQDSGLYPGAPLLIDGRVIQEFPR